MTREEKTAVIEELKEKFNESPFFYVTDSSAMTVDQINSLRRRFFEKGVQMRVVKNTLVKKALESIAGENNNNTYQGLYEALEGPTAILFSEVANVPAKILRDFRKEKDTEKPVVKAAYIDSAIYIGDEQLEALANLKSKEDLLGELIGLLQSPMSNLLSQLGSGGQNVMGLLKAIEERG